MAEARATRCSIINAHARQIFDSRGQPMIEIDLQTELGLFRAAVPCGSQTNEHEAKELRDGYEGYHGMSVEKAIRNIHDFLLPGIKGMDPTMQQAIDVKLSQDLDGSQSNVGAWTKKRMGANAVYAVSQAVCQAGAAAAGLPNWQHISNLALNRSVVLPVPIIHLFDGGRRAENGCLYQEFGIMPTGATGYSEAMKMCSETYHYVRKMVEERYGIDAVRVGEYGGFAPPFKDDNEVFEFLVEAINKANYQGKIQIAIDVAAYEFYDKETKLYDLGYKELDNDGTKKISPIALAKKYTDFCTRYPIISITDPFDRDDWINFGKLTASIGEDVQIVGDSCYQGNPIRVQKGMKENGTNGIAVRPIQVGTVWETIELVKLAKSDASGWGIIGATRAGDNANSFLADLCVGLGLGEFKAGGLSNMDSVEKLNHFIRIEEELGQDARYPGHNFRQPHVKPDLKK
jgi:enolase